MNVNQETAVHFLEMISSAALANPFSDERDKIDQAIVAEWLPQSTGRDLEVEKITELLFSVLEKIKDNSALQAAIRDRHKQLLSDASLFAVFHKYTADFDHYIQIQNNTPGIILELPFAEKIESDLAHYGFKNSSAHYIAIFFQMRRAFYFVSQFVGGASAPVRELREKLWRTLFTADLRQYIEILFDKMESFSVLVLGETGVGKGQAAAALGRSAYIPFDSKNKKFVASFLDVFVSANLSEYPETLVESELFGHKKGSFTGALENYSGLFAQTHPNGVLFLDEIGELETPIQVKILRVLQDRLFSPVGSHEKKRFSGRLIAATNANLNEKVAMGAFRSDLYHRLAADVIHMPPLRERFSSDRQERRRLVAKILQRFLGTGDSLREGRVFELLDDVVPKDYSWPGNLREFEQVIRRIVLHDRFLEREQMILPQGNTSAHNAKAHVGFLNWQGLQWTADEVMAHYARSAYDVLGSYEKVAQKLNVDWRTAKRWITLPALSD